MKRSTTRFTTLILALAAFAIQLVLAPAAAEAAYDDRSDELPGMHDFPTELVVIGGLAIVGLLVYKASKKDKDNSDDATETIDTGAATEDTDTDNTQSSDEQSFLPAEQEQGSPFSLKVGLDFDHDQAPLDLGVSGKDLPDATVRVGVSFGF